MSDIINSKDHGLLFKGDMVCGVLDDTKTETRRLITARNSVFDGAEGVGIREAFALPEFLRDSFIDPGPSPAGNEGPYLKCPIKQFDTVHRVYPRIQVGDRIWVKETWKLKSWSEDQCDIGIQYRSDDGFGWANDESSGENEVVNEQIAKCIDRSCMEIEEAGYECGDDDLYVIPKGVNPIKWKSSMLMPRWASRILLEVTAVWPERLQDITYEGAKAEGVGRSWDGTAYWYKNYFGGVSDFKRDPIKSYISLWQSINGWEDKGWEANPLVWVYQFKRVVV